MSRKIVVAVGACGVIVITSFCGTVLDHLFTVRTKLEIGAVQQSGAELSVEVTKIDRGVYVSGGHGWSIGRSQESYEVTLSHDPVHPTWHGVGVPITLNSNAEGFYLVTYDRQIPSKTEFRCYRLRFGTKVWEPLPLAEFPWQLADNNLLQVDTASSKGPKAKEYSNSLFGRFWYCLANNVQDWEIEVSISDAFIAKFDADRAIKSEKSGKVGQAAKSNKSFSAW